MKKIILTLAVALLGITATQAQVRTMVIKNNDGTITRFETSKVQDVSFEEIDIAPKTHEYVDLGLTSGTLWATCNVGALKPEEYGDYFAWGETTPKKNYAELTYAWNDYKGYFAYIKYNDADGKTELEHYDDAATVNWGSDWCIPSKEQYEELIDQCNWTYTTMNDVKGYLVSSKSNGNSIFLPAAGIYSYDEVLKDGKYYTFAFSYASREVKDNILTTAWGLYINPSSEVKMYWEMRYRGSSIRPVRVAE